MLHLLFVHDSVNVDSAENTHTHNMTSQVKMSSQEWWDFKGPHKHSNTNTHTHTFYNSYFFHSNSSETCVSSSSTVSYQTAWRRHFGGLSSDQKSSIISNCHGWSGPDDDALSWAVSLDRTEQISAHLNNSRYLFIKTKISSSCLCSLWVLASFDNW